jgi:hypothetical protein
MPNASMLLSLNGDKGLFNRKGRQEITQRAEIKCFAFAVFALNLCGLCG